MTHQDGPSPARALLRTAVSAHSGVVGALGAVSAAVITLLGGGLLVPLPLLPASHPVVLGFFAPPVVAALIVVTMRDRARPAWLLAGRSLWPSRLARTGVQAAVAATALAPVAALRGVPVAVAAGASFAGIAWLATAVGGEGAGLLTVLAATAAHLTPAALDPDRQLGWVVLTGSPSHRTVLVGIGVGCCGAVVAVLRDAGRVQLRR